AIRCLPSSIPSIDGWYTAAGAAAPADDPPHPPTTRRTRRLRDESAVTYLFDDPTTFTADAVEGLVAAHPEELLRVHGGVVRARATPAGQPALVVGGGSGHYPAFAGWVGRGVARGAACGNMCSSATPDCVQSVARNADGGGGVILGFGHYAGDVLHFGAAAEKLRAEGIDVRIGAVSGDVASGEAGNHRDRRGIAGDLTVFKI